MSLFAIVMVGDAKCREECLEDWWREGDKVVDEKFSRHV
jgi:hypothetical protein